MLLTLPCSLGYQRFFVSEETQTFICLVTTQKFWCFIFHGFYQICTLLDFTDSTKTAIQGTEDIQNHDLTLK